MDAIEQTKKLWRQAEFAWGSHDCILAACDHVQRVTGIDPAAPWRGSYSDEASAQAIYDAHGGVLGLFDYGMRRAGFRQGENKKGAVVVANIGQHEVVGVNFGAMVGFVHPQRGLTEVRLPVVAAWPL